MKGHRLSGATARLTLAGIGLWALAQMPMAAAQSDGRIPERLTGDWLAPRIEDLARFAKAAQASDKDTDKLSPKERADKIAAVKSLLANGKVNGPQRAGVMAKLAEMSAAQVDDVYSDEQKSYETA